MNQQELTLRYGFNPHQTSARVTMQTGDLPFRVLNGVPSIINIMDALNAWQAVSEMRQVFGLPAAASFKHVSPSGAGLAIPLSDTLKEVYFVEGEELSPLAVAYARARGCDRMSSYGDCAGLSDVVDLSVARLLRYEVSDVIIAPGYVENALEMLKQKKGSKYVIIEMDKNYKPDEVERRSLYGVILEQQRNDFVPSHESLVNIVTKNRDIPSSAERDLLLSMIVLKYTQSNSMCFSFDGQTIGIGAGQQSRINCTQIAASKADMWFLRQHSAVLNIQFKKEVKHRYIKDNVIGAFLDKETDKNAYKRLEDIMIKVPPRLGYEERQAWLSNMQGVTLGSDGLIPFRDNIDRANRSGVKYIVQPGGSTRDNQVLQAADEYGMVMVCSGVRLFHH